MKGSVKLVTIKGISVYLHFTLLFLIVWLLFLYWASSMEWQQLLWSFVFLAAVFASIIAHEYGHAFVAAWFGIRAKKITIYPIGGIASIEKLPENPKQELLISGAGPGVSFVLAAVLLLFAPQPFSWQGFQDYTAELDQTNILYTLGWVNIALAVFNLIPAFPMDGGRMLRALLAFRFNYLRATGIAATIGRAIAALMIVFALFTMNILLALIGVFIIVFARAEETYLYTRNLVKGIQLKDVVMHDYGTMDAGLTTREAATMLGRQHDSCFIVMREGRPVGTLLRRDLVKALADQEYGRTISSLMNESSPPFEAEMPVEDVLNELAADKEKIYPVFAGGKFLGVVSFSHIIEYLLIHKAAAGAVVPTKSLAQLV